jgi:thioredoxin reductase
MTKNNHDVIIIGGGAAGLSAALVLSRARWRTLVIDAGEPRNAAATEMHGFLSRDGMPPADLLVTGRTEVLGYGGAIEAARVSSVERGADGRFAVTLEGGDILTARALLVTTGRTDELPLIPGLRDRWGGSVHHCPYCHGHEVRGQSIVVIGGANPAVSVRQVGLLRHYSDRVRFVSGGIPLASIDRDRLDGIGVPVIDGQVSHLVGPPSTLTGVGLADGTVLECESVFVAPRPRPNDDVLRELDCAIDPETALVATSTTGETSIPGVWAAGNVVTPTAQVITAAGAGSASAIAISGWLLAHDLDAAVAARHP